MNRPKCVEPSTSESILSKQISAMDNRKILLKLKADYHCVGNCSECRYGPNVWDNYCLAQYTPAEKIAALIDALKELGVDVIATIYRLEETIGRKPDADDMADWHDSIRRGACWQEDAQYHDALYMWMLLTGNYQPPKEAEHEN